MEVGFVDGLFEMYKLRLEIAKARADLISDSVCQAIDINLGHFFSIPSLALDPLQSTI